MRLPKKLALIGGCAILALVIVVSLYFLVYRRSSNSAKTAANYSDSTKKELDQGKCGSDVVSELEKKYKSASGKDDYIAGQIQYDLGQCAIYNNENDKALGYYNKSAEHFTKAKKDLELERSKSAIDFVSARLERNKQQASPSEDQVGGS